MPDRRISRRRLLAASVPLAVGLAGCSGGGDGDGGTTTGAPATAGGTGTTAGGATTTTAPGMTAFPDLTSDDPAYRRWQPGTGEAAGILDAAHNVGRARARRDALPAETYERQGGWTMFNGYVGVEFDELDGLALGLRSQAAVYLGSFAREDVTARLLALPYEQFDARGDVDYYRWDRGDRVAFVGVGDAAVVAGGVRADRDDPAGRFRDAARPLYDTATGERSRLHEESDLYRRYTDAVGWPLFAWAASPVPANSGGGIGISQSLPGEDALPEAVVESVRVGITKHLADGAVVDRYWLWTVEDGPASPDAIREAYENPVVRREALVGTGGDAMALRSSGRVVEVAVLHSVTDPGGGADPPLVAVEATVDGGTLTLRHFGGDPLPLARVTVRGGGDPLSLGDGELRPGESASVDLPEDGESYQAVVYSPPATDVTTVIAEA